MKNMVTQKDEKPLVTGLDDAAILHIKIEITDKMYSFKKAQFRNTLNPNVPLTLTFPHVLKLIPDKIKPTCNILRLFFIFS